MSAIIHSKKKKCKKIFINCLEHMLNKVASLQTVYMNLFGKYSLQKTWYKH